jgi:hypothetical protein
MPRYIIKLEEKYLVWSTVVDAPITNGLTLEELTDFIEWQHGQEGLADLPDRLKRVEESGTSAVGYNVYDIITYNRAGPNESCLTKEELIEKYVRNPEAVE